MEIQCGNCLSKFNVREYSRLECKECTNILTFDARELSCTDCYEPKSKCKCWDDIEEDSKCK